MKRVLSVILALTLMLSMTIFVSAADPVEIPLTAENLTGSADYFATADQLTFGEGSVTANGVEIFAFALPQNVKVGETVTVHITGSSDGDFRTWLIGADVTAEKGDHATFSEMWKASENGFTSGDFDYTVSLTATDAEPIGGTEANKLCFKAPVAHGTLENLTLTSVSITYEGAAAQDATGADTASGEIVIPLDEDHLGAGDVTFDNGTVTADGISLFMMHLPENVPLGNTVVIHVKGSSDGDFRSWLMAAENTQSTFSNQWKASENGYTSGEFEKYIELTAEDFDSTNRTEADNVAFKAPSYDSNLTNLKLTYLGVIYGTMADIEGDAAAEAQPFADAAAAALEAAKAASDTAGVEAALADAQAAVDALTEKSELGFPTIATMLSDAKSAVKEIEKLIEDSAAEEVLAELQSYIDTVNTALETAQNAGTDVDAISAALADAQAASDHVSEVADEKDYDSVTQAARDLKNTIREIESILEDAEEQKAADEAAAAEKAEKTKQTIMIAVIAVVAVVVIVVVVIVVLKAVKKKKNK